MTIAQRSAHIATARASIPIRLLQRWRDLCRKGWMADEMNTAMRPMTDANSDEWIGKY